MDAISADTLITFNIGALVTATSVLAALIWRLARVEMKVDLMWLQFSRQQRKDDAE